jgi:hypothetical protein
MLRDKLTLLMGLSDVNDAVESLHASRHRCYSVRLLLLLMSACGRYGAAAAKASGVSSSCRSPEEKSSIHNGRVSACHPAKAHLFFPFMLMGILHHRTDSARTTRHRIIMTPAALKPSPRPPPSPPLLPLAPASMLKPCRVDSLATNRPTAKLHTISPFLMHSRDL